MFPTLISKQNPCLVNHPETKVLRNTLWETSPPTEQAGSRRGSGIRAGSGTLERRDLRARPHVSRGWDAPTSGAPPLTQPRPRRCVVLKLASLGMFSFSLGQTVLCFGRNKTSCESFGYNACDYQVAGGSLRACPSCTVPRQPHLWGREGAAHLQEALFTARCAGWQPSLGAGGGSLEGLVLT